METKGISCFALSMLTLSLLGCGGGGGGNNMGNTGNVTGDDNIHDDSDVLSVVVKQEVVDNITSAETFKGANGVGFVEICPGEESASEPRNFLFKVHGFSPDNPHKVPQEGGLQETCDSLPENRNYHVFEARYRNGGDYIQRNSGFIRELLSWATEKYKITADDKVAVVGYSMGGVVSRHALLSMQVAGIENKVDLFVTVDSPHHGAYSPLGVQTLANAFADHGGAAALAYANAPAAKQMLRYHYTQGSSPQTWTDDYQQLYINEFQGALGGFPTDENMRTVAVSSGRGDGQISSINAGQRYYDGLKRITKPYTINEIKKGNSYCETTFNETDLKIDIDITAKAYALDLIKGEDTLIASTDVESYVVVLKPDGTRSYRVNTDSQGTTLPNYIKSRISSKGLGCHVIDLDKRINKIVDDEVANAISKGKAQAKPHLDAFDNKKYGAFNDGSTSEGVPGGLGFDIGLFRALMSDGKFVPVGKPPAISLADNHSFIPLGSALGIEGLDPTAAKYLQHSDLEIMSPFDQIYFEADENLAHLQTSSSWFSKEVNSLFNQ